jgi:hypothetical protein
LTYSYDGLKQFPLGVELKDEHKLDEMCAIKYVPTIQSEECIILPDGNNMQITTTNVYETPFGENFLTAVRARGAA